MNCQDFDRLCQELLDARDGVSSGIEALLEGHAPSCQVCRQSWLGVQVLRQALRSTPIPPSIPSGFADRCLAAFENSPVEVVPFRLRFRPSRAWLSAAAILLASGLAIGLSLRTRERLRPILSPEPATVAEADRPITESLADATSATLTLARDTSAPAARIGRQVFLSATLPTTDWPVALPAEEAGGVLKSVGSQVEKGVRPLSGSAKKAFGFLIPSGLSETRDGA